MTEHKNLTRIARELLQRQTVRVVREDGWFVLQTQALVGTVWDVGDRFAFSHSPVADVQQVEAALRRHVAKLLA